MFPENVNNGHLKSQKNFHFRDYNAYVQLSEKDLLEASQYKDKFDDSMFPSIKVNVNACPAPHLSVPAPRPIRLFLTNFLLFLPQFSCSCSDSPVPSPILLFLPQFSCSCPNSPVPALHFILLLLLSLDSWFPEYACISVYLSARNVIYSFLIYVS